MTKRTATIIAIAFAMALSAAGQRTGPKGTAPENAQYPPMAKTESEKRILSTMSEVVNAGELYANVPAVDGKMLRLLTEAVNAKNVIEIGVTLPIIWPAVGSIKWPQVKQNGFVFNTVDSGRPSGLEALCGREFRMNHDFGREFGIAVGLGLQPRATRVLASFVPVAA